MLYSALYFGEHQVNNPVLELILKLPPSELGLKYPSTVCPFPFRGVEIS